MKQNKISSRQEFLFHYFFRKCFFFPLCFSIFFFSIAWGKGKFIAMANTKATTSASATMATKEKATTKAKAKAKIYIAFQWHMHQPIYWPYENIQDSMKLGRYSFNLYDIFSQRMGPYTSWPKNAIETAMNASLPYAGAQVSFSGSLIENLNNLYGYSWAEEYRKAYRWKTALGNPRLDLVAFGYHHPMMPLIDYEDIRSQIQGHRQTIAKTFGADIPYSKGIFPPENAFAEWMIPALVDEGLEWVMVDNIHLNRAVKNYPWTKSENLFPPNPSDQRNPSIANEEWIQLQGVWAPSKVSAWAERPHWVVYRDPQTGEVARTPEGKVAKMIAIPTERYLGNEDGRGGFGALNYDFVMSQFEKVNNDSQHPILLVLHHDGDNYGGGTESYYHGNFAQFVNWLKSNNERFELVTVQDYLSLFPPDADDIIHAEPGSWSGADNGDPEFKKWFGDPENSYSPDRNSWAVLTAADNLMKTVKGQGRSFSAPLSGPLSVSLSEALSWRLVSETSCYEYWDGKEPWDSHPTRASNRVFELLSPYLASSIDRAGPSVLIPQREPYNPGGYEWAQVPEKNDFEVWTYVYDVSGLEKVQLFYQVQAGIKTPLDHKFPTINHKGKMKSENWKQIEMIARKTISKTDPLPHVKADEYSAIVKGVQDALVSYQVRAFDKLGNESRSIVQYVYVGKGGSDSSPTIDVGMSPEQPDSQKIITIYSKNPGKLHWGVNSWKLPIPSYWPKDSQAWFDKKAIQSPLLFNPVLKRYEVQIGPFSNSDQVIFELNFTFYFEDGKWGPRDFKVPIVPGKPISRQAQEINEL